MKGKTKHIIFDSYNVTSKENMEGAKETILENMFFNCNSEGYIEVEDNFGVMVKINRDDYAKTITDDRLYDECYEENNFWWEDSYSELKRVNEGSLIAIANVGRWNGNFSGYKEVKSLQDTLYSNCDYQELYLDSNGDLHKSESHHDGSNSILYRYWKEGLTDTQKENFMDKIYNGTCTQKDITRYTRKAGLEIARVFGWKVRGIKKVA